MTDLKLPELLPCAHCGGAAEFAETSPVDCFVSCVTCGVGTPGHRVDAEAISAWNRRAYATAAVRAEREARARDGARLDFLLANHATVETDGEGNWRAVLEWTEPQTYFPYAKDSRAAIDAAIQQENDDAR